jgi:hypothetical protein
MPVIDKYYLAVQVYIGGAWVDLTCDTGEIDIRQGYQRPDPLAPYEVGTCDVLLKGLTYAPTVNAAILPGVPFKVFVFKYTDIHEFSNAFTVAFRNTSPTTGVITLFTGSILDAKEDHRNNTVTIQAVDAWHKVVNMSITNDSMTSKTFDELANLAFWADNGITVEKRDAFTLWGTGANAGVKLSATSQPAAGTTWVTPVQKGGPFNYELKVGNWTSGDFNFTVNRIKAAVANNCERGNPSATYDNGTATSSALTGSFASTTSYWRYEVVINSVANAYYLSGIKPRITLSYMPVITDETLHQATQTALGTIWVNPENKVMIGNSSVWSEPSAEWIGPTFVSNAHRFSDDHLDVNGHEYLFGEHMCYRDFEQNASLGGVVNVVERNNLNESQVKAVTTEESTTSITTYGRRQISVNTLVATGTDWTANGILVATADPDAWVRKIEADLTMDNFNLLPEVLDWVRFEHGTTIQTRRVAGRRITLTPKRYDATIELFDYIPFRDEEA